jgi:uncharacterized protein (TIGR02757 family)
MGVSPYEFVRNFGKAERNRLKTFKHRFTTGRDISDLLTCFKKVLQEYTSIEEFFMRGCEGGDRNIVPGLTEFCNSILAIHARKHDGKTSRGLNYLLVNPANGSACKRLNLFLRWMVRDDDVDTGLWKSVDKCKLIVPIDVHMGRLCSILGFHEKKVVSLSTAIQITDCFAQIEPADPVKYDFALSRVGIVENCTGRQSSACPGCELLSLCGRQ